MQNIYSTLPYTLFLLLTLFTYCKCVFLYKNQQQDLTNPSNRRHFQLYSKFGLYLTISENGTVGATKDMNDPDTILMLESYSVGIRRIRRPNSYYLAVDKRGYITSRKKPRKDTLFYEHYGKFKTRTWLWFENYDNHYVLALKTKKTLTRKLTKYHGAFKHKKKFEFLTLLLS